MSLAVLFDLDGVISDTASVHAKAWKAVFDKVLASEGQAYLPFNETEDYVKHVDGKTRLIGITDFLNSRGLTLPLGRVNDATIQTIHGVGNTKNTLFREFLESTGVSVFWDTIRLIEVLREGKVDLGLASSSKNAQLVLEKAGLSGVFKAILDGVIAEECGVASKPDPEFYRYAAQLLRRVPSDCIVVEDAISGVVSAKQSGAGLVIGVCRRGDGRELIANGADIVVTSLDKLDVGSPASCYKRLRSIMQDIK